MWRQIGRHNYQKTPDKIKRKLLLKILKKGLHFSAA